MPNTEKKAAARIRAGIGGWTYAPWRDNFYPADLPQKQELAYASRQVSAIEINGTYYRTQTPASFDKWRKETPDDFVFSLKASRYCTAHRVLAQAGDSVERFIGSGISALQEKLGPIVWQFPPTKVFDADDFGAFLALLPKTVEGIRLRHVLDVRNDSFMAPEYLALARRHGMATVFTDSPDYPSFADPTGDVIYSRLMCSEERYRAGYAPKALDEWAARARQWAEGGLPADLPYVGPRPARDKPEAVFVFFINGYKEAAPAAAQALLQRLV
jgi:uncharacterized protein YecE (DUF72 family)